MSTLKSAFAALLILGMSAGLVSQGAFANDQFRENHPRRVEVLNRDQNLRNDIRQDRGNLGGHYNNLMAQDRRIQRQEQRDARRNGGMITNQEQRRLNREENRLHRNINRDYR